MAVQTKSFKSKSFKTKSFNTKFFKSKHFKTSSLPRLTVPILMTLILFPVYEHSQADALFGSEFEVEGQLLLKDHEQPHVYYLVPPPPSIAQTDGDLGVFLSLTHYIGTELRHDVGQDRINWSMLVALERTSITPAQRSAIISSLQKSTEGRRDIVLRDLPISSVPTSVTYQGIDTADEDIQLNRADVVANEEPGASSSTYQGAYWTRRNLSFALSPNDGIAMRAAFDAGGAIMSISTHYQALGVRLDESDPSAAVYARVNEVVAPSAIRVQLNRDSHPNYLRVVDLNSISPPGYVGLTMLCYDFSGDEAMATLALKKVELEAEGVTGRVIKTSLQFQRSEEGISLQYAKFPFAVRVDRPFRYRTRSYDLSGALKISEWTSAENWAIPIDVTSYPEHEPVKQSASDQSSQADSTTRTQEVVL